MSSPCPVCSDPDCQSWALRKNETWHTPPPPRPKPGTKVMVLGAGGAAANGFARALRLAGGFQLIGTNCNESDLWLSECEENCLIPHVSDYHGWLKAVYDIVRRERPAFIHAQSDAEVEALGRFRSALHMLGTKTYLPTDTVIGLCRDKWESYKVWHAAAVAVPETKLCSSRDAISSMIGLGKHQKVWMRPRTGAGGQKSFVAESYKEVVWWLDRHNGWDQFTIAEVLTPETVTVQALYWHGKLVASQQRTRESWANAGSTTTGVSGSTGVGVTSSDVAADGMAFSAIETIDPEPHGLYGVDMARRESGTPCVTEINIGRFFTTAPEFFAMAGFNFAEIYVRDGENAQYMNDCGFGLVPPPFYGINPIADGKRWIRGMDKLPVLA